jgi:molybdenum cofactor synthesis domain-containing protein
MSETKYAAAVITVSDKGSRGERVDEAGPAVAEILAANGFDVVYRAIVPDERADIARELIKCSDELDIALVVTTGGTGFSPRDITPEATLSVVTRRAPGIPEAMRYESLKITNRAMLSRCEAGIRGGSLIINLPGSTKAARENLAAVVGALEHGLEMLRKPQRDHV